MSGRGYNPRIFAMHQTQALNEQIQEMGYETWVKVEFIRALMKAHWRAECASALSDLKALDPQGWERWYDMEVADGNARFIAEQVRKRIEDLEDPRSFMQIMRDIDVAETIATRISDDPRRL